MTPLTVSPDLPYHLQFFHELMKDADKPIIWVLFIMVIIDITTGYYRSLVAPTTIHKTQSTKGWIGLAKHSLIIGMITLLYPLLATLGFGAIGDSLVFFYIVTYGVSILENCAQANIPVPRFVKTHLAKLQDDYDQDDMPNKWNIK